MFYWSHLSYVLVWVLLVVHCANFWKWFVVPGLAFLLEKIVGVAVSRMGGLYIVEVNLLPSKVANTNSVGTLYISQHVCYYWSNLQVLLLLLSSKTSLLLSVSDQLSCRAGDSPGDQTTSVLPFQTWRLCLHQHPGDRQV